MTRTFWSSMPARAVLACACLLLACTGTSTGNPDDGDVDAGQRDAGGNTETGAGGGYAQCDAKSMDLMTLDTQSSLGFSANDVLALIGDEHSLSVEWLAGGNDLQITPAPGESTLHISVTPRDTKPRLVQLDMKTDTGGGAEIGLAQPLGDPCPDRIEVDVHVTLQSDDGGLDEAFDVTLRAQDTRQVSLVHTIAAADIGGSLRLVTSGALAAFTLDAVQVETTFSKLGVSGSLMPTLVSDTKDTSSASTGSGGVAAAGGVLARWPAGEACSTASQGLAGFGGRAVPVALDDTFGDASAMDAIDLVNAAGALTLSFAQASPTPLHVTFTPSGAVACARYGNVMLGDTTDGVQLSIAGTLDAQSDDAVVDAHWPLTLTAYFDAADRLDRVEIDSDPTGGIVGGLVAAQEFEDSYGITGFDLSSYDQANALVALRWNPGPPTVAMGTLTVQGANVPMCASDMPAPQPPSGPGIDGGAPGGSAGCQGIDVHQVATATIASE